MTYQVECYLLSELARCAWRTVRDVYGFVLGEEYKAGMVGTIQTFGSEGL